MKTVFGFFLKLLETAIELIFFIVFQVLLWLRPVARILLGLGAFGGLVGAAIVLLGMHGPQKSFFVYVCFGIGVGSLSLMWVYDSILFRLSPRPLILFN